VGKYHTILRNEYRPNMIGMRYNQVLENLGNMQIRREYLLVSGERETQYFEVCGDIDLRVMRIRDYASQNPKVLIECHRHHSLSCCWPPERPESLDYLTPAAEELEVADHQLSPIGGIFERLGRHGWPCCGSWASTIDYDECFNR
jgi:hypothetical protein